ncbi:MAG: DUF1127 domain-containing protein [Rhodospirillales bacterium]
MFDTLINAAATAIKSFTEPQSIRRIDDGRAIDGHLARQLGHLPDRLLHDIGFHRGR